MANHHIQNGDLSVLSSTKDNHILDDSSSFNLDEDIVSLVDVSEITFNYDIWMFVLALLKIA